jgi:quercetin dioxygenase-like cupin family protein
MSVNSETGAPQTSVNPTAPIRIIDFENVPEVVTHPPGSEGEQRNRPLLSLGIAGTPDVVADVITFAPGFIHHMHRHFHADQIMVPLRGYVVVVDETWEEQELRPGQLLVVPRYNWHEARNVSDQDCQVLHMFGGVGDLSEIGFELWQKPNPQSASQ